MLRFMLEHPGEKFRAADIASIIPKEELPLPLAKSRLAVFFQTIARRYTLPFHKEPDATGYLHWFDPEEAGLLLARLTVDKPLRGSIKPQLAEGAPAPTVGIDPEGVIYAGRNAKVLSPVCSSLLKILREHDGTMSMDSLYEIFVARFGDTEMPEFIAATNLLHREFALAVGAKVLRRITVKENGESKPAISIPTFHKVGVEPQDKLSAAETASNPFISEKTLEYMRSRQKLGSVDLANYIASRPPSLVRGYYVSPTGSGKTVTFGRLLDDVLISQSNIRTLIVEPTVPLRDQTLEALLKHGYSGKVAVVEAGMKYNANADVVIMTAASFVKRFEGRTSNPIDPDDFQMVVIDEAHHLQGAGAHSVLKTQFQHAMWLGFTATPDYDAKRRVKYILPDLIHEVTTEEAIEERLIAPFTVVHLQTHADFSTVRILGKEYDQAAMLRAINISSRNEAIARFAVAELRGSRTMFNCSRIEHAEALAKELQAHGFSALAYHGKLSEKEQEARLRAFRDGSVSGLVQVSKAGEGLDIPEIEAVVNASSTLSYVRAKQRAGRGQRLNPNDENKVALIVECVDDNYMRTPTLYESSKLGGGWSLFPANFAGRAAAEARLERLAQYTDASYTVITEQTAPEIDEDLQAVVDQEVFVRQQPAPAYFGTSDDTPPKDEVIIYEGRKFIYKSAESLSLKQTRTLRSMREARRAARLAGPVNDRDSNTNIADSEPSPEEEYVAFLAAEKDFRISTEPQTPSEFMGQLKYPEEIAVAEFLFGHESSIDDERAAEAFVTGTSVTVRKIMSKLVTNAHLSGVLSNHRITLLQEQLMTRASKKDKPVVPVSVRVKTLSNLIDNLRPEWSAKAACNGLALTGKVARRQGNYADRRNIVEAEERKDTQINTDGETETIRKSYTTDVYEPFFPARGESTREFKDICRKCDVAALCLKFSLENGEKNGIWGGFSERERRRFRRAFGAQVQTPEMRQQLIQSAGLSGGILAQYFELIDQEQRVAAEAVS